eukprot:9341428-Alexandrium_andersonii.AAC.1
MCLLSAGPRIPTLTGQPPCATCVKPWRACFPNARGRGGLSSLTPRSASSRLAAPSVPHFSGARP